LALNTKEGSQNSLTRPGDRAEENLPKPTPDSNVSSPSDQELQRLLYESLPGQAEEENRREEIGATQQERARSNLWWESLFEAAPVGYFLLNQDGLILSANLAGARLLGTEISFLLNKSFSGFVADDDHAEYDNHFRKVFETRSGQTCQLRLLGVDRVQVDAQLHSMFLEDGNDGLCRCRIAVVDIRDRMRSKILVSQLQRMKDEADMAQGIALNLNNLLQIVMGGVHMALLDLEVGDLSEIKSNLEEILQNAESVRRLQSFVHVSHRDHPSENKVVDLSDIVKHASMIARPWWKTIPEKDGLTVNLNLDLKKGCFVNGKESELFEVAVNLIKNAAEAMPQGGDIRLRTFVKEERVVLEIEDTGTGIAEEHLKRVFEPFWSTKGIRGTGMGLAVSSSIVSQHGGTITVDSKKSGGATFTVRLPLVGELPSDKASEKKAFERQLTVLVIDDIAPVADLVGTTLKRSGHVAITALSGTEGITRFKEHDIDVVICDLVMPEMNGWEVGRAIKDICAKNGVPKTPFILLSGWAGDVLEKEKISDSGVDAIMGKPLQVSKFAEVIQDIFGEA
jgi:two-component system, cell cycle sensor histidine kinase and response regulator CckA